eukprot:GEMP01132916.1.p1 GENE.GEMP01132916.1~~GEMP01132916.1.p1  ORF type:complete len:105 (+),score=0.55 GEMP01132916.1:147-461(+)
MIHMAVNSPSAFFSDKLSRIFTSPSQQKTPILLFFWNGREKGKGGFIEERGVVCDVAVSFFFPANFKWGGGVPSVAAYAVADCFLLVLSFDPLWTVLAKTKHQK